MGTGVAGDIQTGMIKPYYDSDGITIYHADCRDVLPQLEPVDCVITSPPYNMIPSGKPSGLLAEARCKKTESYESYEDNLPQEEYEQFIHSVVSRCLHLSPIVWVNHKTRFVDRVARHPIRFLDFPLFAEVIWARPGSTTLNAKRYAPSHEFILGFGVPKYWDRCHDTKLTVWRMAPETDISGHPCPFPLEIPQRLIASSCVPNGTVLDPFMGSGTTLVAAKLEGKKAIGIELEERYCEIAAERLRQGVLQFTG